MNNIERRVHAFMAKYPALQMPLVAAYQRVCSLWPSKNWQAVPIIQRQGFFFGFHDKCPWDSQNQLVLAHKFDTGRPVGALGVDSIEVGVFEDAGLGTFRVLGQTRSWNWQQGASLQWVGTTRTCIFNDMEKGQPVARIVGADGVLKMVLLCHIASVSPNGKFALTSNFDLLGRGLAGYGYSVVGDGQSKVRVDPKEEGLQVVEVDSGRINRLLALEDLSGLARTIPEREGLQFLSHHLFSQNSQRFLFFHWSQGKHRVAETRLFSSDVRGEQIYCFPGHEYSHIAWWDDQNVLCYCKPPDKQSGYYLAGDGVGTFRRVGAEFFKSDGHPHVSPNRRFFLTDTYPDRLRNQRMFVYDLAEDKGIVLLKARIPFYYSRANRCDFHPRWNRDGTLICFDSAHSGVRSLCVMPNPLGTH